MNLVIAIKVSVHFSVQHHRYKSTSVSMAGSLHVHMWTIHYHVFQAISFHTSPFVIWVSVVQ